MLRAFGRRTAFEVGDRALPLMLGPNFDHKFCQGEHNEWLCIRFNSADERDDFKAAAREWENVARDRAEGSTSTCTACGDTGTVTDTKGKAWPCYRHCAALASPPEAPPPPPAAAAAWPDRVRRLIAKQQADPRMTALNTATERYLKAEIDRLHFALAATPAPEAITDSQRMDWLEEHTLNVRVCLRYGSRDLFWAVPSEGDGETIPSDLRKRIDDALKAAHPGEREEGE